MLPFREAEKKGKKFENAAKEDLVTVLHEMGETFDSHLEILELKHKLLLCKAYLEDEGFVCDALATMIEDRMEKEKKIEQYRKEVQEQRLERKQELELVRIEEARRKTENETRIREARHKEEMEVRLSTEEEARHKDEEEVRLKPEEEAKAVEERRNLEEERRMNEIIALEEETRLEKERWLVEEQMRHVQEEHKMRMKAEEGSAYKKKDVR
ncbi:hypothetical protein TNIN_306171 [Trichonephila inaurata madagascariensis]|uniref:Uncharacterized protein n=1 Tax=Trichonephila inaurata madagascariensis TaxID=2747483 RepID=A0A8X6XX30_9ARAC|nr:hypothetical protein TNIN_306171 [Trichonephila inaurata madagascariensis]